VKVLFIHAACKPTDGGVYPFVQAVTGALKEFKTNHEFGFKELRMQKEFDADFVWFLTPHFEVVQAPFAMTVWDLGHRILPEFPEVSLSGWTFDQREAFYQYVLPRAAIVITGNVQGATEIRQFYRIQEKRILLNPLPVSETLLKIEPSAVSEYPKPYLLYPAQFWPHKNHITLIDAVKILGKYTLVFTGADKGNRNFVETYARTQKVSINCPGFVSLSVLKGLYLNAHAVVFPSLLGPDNLPPLEARALGCPLVECATVDPYTLAKAIQEVKQPQDTHVPTARQYAERIVKALDGFAPTRRLWGTYRHI
jgi:glycosyltransferase involved in cell wall biosynthesis